MQMNRGERSVGELFAELSRDMATLVRQEVHLAKTEVSQKASQMGKDIGFLAVGGAVAYAGCRVPGAPRRADPGARDLSPGVAGGPRGRAGGRRGRLLPRPKGAH